MRQVYEETKEQMTPAERMEMLLAIGRQQVQELKHKKFTQKKNRERRKAKIKNPSAGVNPGLAKYLEQQKEKQ